MSFKQVRLLSDEALTGFENAILRFYVMQARKIGEYRRAVDALSGSTFEKLSAILELLEEKDKEALYQVQKFFPSSQTLRSLFDPVLPVACEMLGCEDALLDGPVLFINRPNTKRLLYTWHSEGHWYPKRRKLVNVWLPIFGDKGPHNGTMSFKLGSHEANLPFAEYSNGNNAFHQYEIPENFLTGFETHHVVAKRGDVVLFHKDLVHRSNENRSDKYSFAVVARIWTPVDDLTLSGPLIAKPYGQDIGRANLVVNP